MGGGSWTSSAWKDYASRTIDTAATVDDIYTSEHMHKDLNPKGVTIRESRDSSDNPESNAVIIALDVTGSMSSVLEAMARKGLQTVAEEIYDRQPITQPQIMFMGVGDANYDSAPLQVTQFESDIRIAEWLTKIYLERGGGGNDSESYIFPWYFAATRTALDCFEKRGKKGVLFTVGDECPTPYLTADQIEEFLGERPQFDKVTAQEALTMVSRQYEVFHLMVEQGSFYRSEGKRVLSEWQNLLGQHALPLADHTKMGEVIVSTLQILAGENKSDVINSWDGSTGMVVKKAISGLSVASADANGLVKF
jgi:hypothetical protein